VQEGSAASVATVTATAAPTPTPAPTAAPVPSGKAYKSVTGKDVYAYDVQCEVVYEGMFGMTSGVRLDSSMLGGRYAVVFHEDGTCDFTIAGYDVPGITWSKETNDAEGIVLVVDYYTAPLRFQSFIDSDGKLSLELNYFDAMIIVFEIKA